MTRFGLYALFLLTAFFDSLENAGALGVVLADDNAQGWIRLLLVGKQGKLVVMQLVPLMTLAGILVGGGGWLWTKLRR